MRSFLLAEKWRFFEKNKEKKIMERSIEKKEKNINELNENKIVLCPYCGKRTVINDYGLGRKIRQCNTVGCRLHNDYFSYSPDSFFGWHS